MDYNYSYDNYEDSNGNSTFMYTPFIFNFRPNSTEVITPYKWVALLIYIAVFCLGVPGNALVVWMTAFEMKRTVNTVWFLNLAIADLACCLVVPFSIMEIALYGRWPLGLFLCKCLPSVLLVNMYASVLLLTVISIDRCALVIKPVWCQNKRTVKKAYLACLVVWLFAFLWSSPSFIFRQTVKRFDAIKCSMQYSLLGAHQQKTENIIAIFRFLIGFIIPFLVITISYSILVSKVSGRFSQSSKTMKVVLVVIIGFFVCWFPYHVAGIILAAHSNNSSLYISTLNIDPILISIAFVNSCINPIIYVLVGRDFKTKFKQSITSILRNVLTDEVSQTFDSKKTKSTSDTKNTETHV
ncbi:C5a anaphylatoxin chemotactic receptor 1-like [Spea bombifrons]|uniref:C5a anaphylatoxin chemotactic receptor 1-like n=1 Tax=Spea bombifrons TaxID=233779 RepID=UPI00234A985C|nr:C5a anaphylatoxin chemotactic receptor 1-like [Spea bombifrons]